MPSINFNMSAMVALNTLQSVNRDLSDVQNQISTGKKISTARDNASIWAVSTVMESDVMSFKTITDSLNLGAATVGTARSAAEQVTSLLQEMKSLATAAQEENVDRVKIQRDVTALRDQIGSIVSSAQFNGLNLIQAGEDVQLLASLNRSSNNVVTPERISIGRVDLTQTVGTTGAGIAAGTGAISIDDGTNFAATGSLTVGAATPPAAVAGELSFQVDDAGADGNIVLGAETTYTIDFGGGATVDAVIPAATYTQESLLTAIETALDGAANVPAGVTYAVSGTGAAAELTFSNNSGVALNVAISDDQSIANDADGFIQVVGDDGVGSGELVAVTPAFSVATTDDFVIGAGIATEGDLYSLNIGGESIDVRAREGDTISDVVEKLIARATAVAPDDVTFEAVSGGNVLRVSNGSSNGVAISLTANSGTVGGALEDLTGLSVTTTASAASALGDIEDMLDRAIDAAASFGSAQRRIDIQNDFISSLVQSLEAGVSALTDANLEEASARLQSLQVQQQLGIQALTIANQSPQAILALFR